MLEKIKSDLPNIPEEVINLWLLPFAEELGWPPNGKTWNLRLGMEPIVFWNDAVWKKETLNLSKLEYSKGYFDVMRGLHEAYIESKENDYLKALGEGGKKRYISCYKYIVKNQKFPQPPILYVNEIGEYEIIDGNHRFFALVSVTRAQEQFEMLSEEQKKSFLGKAGIKEFLPPEDEQEVWVCYPLWENSLMAKTRNYLREQGLF